MPQETDTSPKAGLPDALSFSKTTSVNDDARPERVDQGAADDITGILLVILSVFLFAGVSATVKSVPVSLPIQIEIRSAIQLALSLVVVAAQGKFTEEGLFGRPEDRVWLLLRGLLYWVFLSAWWASVTRMPVGDATALVYCSPIVTSLAATLFLKEKLRNTFVPKTLLALSGAVLIVKPSWLSALLDVAATADNDGRGTGAAFAFVAAIAGGLLPILARASKNCNWLVVVQTSSTISALVLAPLAIALTEKAPMEAFSLLFQDENAIEYLLKIAAASALGFVALAANTKGYQLAEASKVCYFSYLEIPFSYVLQWIIFGEGLDTLGVFGATCILGSCAIALREVFDDAKAGEMA
ncbi:hypothetical protein CYMTET_54779 [Cymbomonas tetramitiformis]|uniref:EamA domain-containing protein n=1 Tax=Cymbomonas tetramitiformis TaxID=36881 RepID=A0AAE0ENN6_9CHLO|nr:hypothetical protein CYMTET_54779 [Cymbomonas tetramitiformis]|eukprot:gene12954-15315_t